MMEDGVRVHLWDTVGKEQQYYVNTSSKFDIFVTLPLFMAINNHKQITFSFSICSDVRSECRPSVLQQGSISGFKNIPKVLKN